MSEQRTQDGAVQRWGASAALFACAWAVGAESAANGPADGDRVLMGLALGLGLAMIAMAWRARGANAAANAVLVAATGAGAAAATTSGATCTGASLLKTLAPGAYMGAGVGLAAAGLAVAAVGTWMVIRRRGRRAKERAALAVIVLWMAAIALVDSESGMLCESAAAAAGVTASIARAILAGGLILGVVILVHELGHAVAAWACRVQVEAISVGFGPKVIGGRLGRWTTWEVRALPVGGFAALKGMETSAQTAEAGSYRHASVASKTLILLGGPAANMVLAVAAMTGVEMMGREGPLPVVGWVYEGGPAARTGLARGDRIVAIDGQPTALWADANAAISAAAISGSNVEVQWDRGARCTPQRSSCPSSGGRERERARGASPTQGRAR